MKLILASNVLAYKHIMGDFITDEVFYNFISYEIPIVLTVTGVPFVK